MSEILKIKDLWGGYTEGVDILRGISMEVQQGEAVGIIGLNGSGKSTFGKAIMNMIPIRRGEILFNGEDITAFSTSQLAHRGISIMQQGGRVFPNLSVWDNLQLAIQGDISHLADIIPLLRHPKKKLQHWMADKLSGGQKHQLALAMSLTPSTKFLILDEPSAGLSPKASVEMYHFLTSVQRLFDVSIIIIEQNIAKALEFCDYVYLFENGFLKIDKKLYNYNEVNNIMFHK